MILEIMKSNTDDPVPGMYVCPHVNSAIICIVFNRDR